MKRAVGILIVLAVLAPASPVFAQSTPVINISTFGIEVCPQSICGAAIFTGFLFGQVGSNPNAIGTVAVGVVHETPLPTAAEACEAVSIFGGRFEFKVGLRRIRGDVAPGGTITSNGDNTFTVDATLVLTSTGTSGQAYYRGILDHNVFPPTVIGTVTQVQPSPVICP